MTAPSLYCGQRSSSSPADYSPVALVRRGFLLVAACGESVHPAVRRSARFTRRSDRAAAEHSFAYHQAAPDQEGLPANCLAALLLLHPQAEVAAGLGYLLAIVPRLLEHLEPKCTIPL